MPARPGNYKDLTGEEFGPLKVVERWGRQSSNVVWICFCQCCGEVQKRNSTHLKNGHRRNCRDCHAEAVTGLTRKVKEPDQTALDIVRSGAPDYLRANRAIVQSLHARIGSMTIEQLEDIEDRVNRELTRRLASRQD